MNVADIGSAIATLFENLTPPTGYTAIQKATSKLQLSLGKLPAVIVAWGGTSDITYGFGERKAVVNYTATLYLPKIDSTTDDTALQAWHDVVIDVLHPQVLLDLSGSPNEVQGAYVRDIQPGEAQVGEPYYAALEISIEVEVWHPVSLTA